jgi:hypothetical protein
VACALISQSGWRNSVAVHKFKLGQSVLLKILNGDPPPGICNDQEAEGAAYDFPSKFGETNES